MRVASTLSLTLSVSHLPLPQIPPSSQLVLRSNRPSAKVILVYSSFVHWKCYTTTPPSPMLVLISLIFLFLVRCLLGCCSWVKDSEPSGGWASKAQLWKKQNGSILIQWWVLPALVWKHVQDISLISVFLCVSMSLHSLLLSDFSVFAAVRGKIQDT